MSSLAVKFSGAMEKLIREPSPAKLFLLNRFIPTMVPFNSSIGVRLKSISKTQTEVSIPFKRANLNHIGGIHACAISTAGEMAAGMLLLRNFSLAKYRIILKELNTSYSYQGKKDLLSKATLTEQDLQEIQSQLSESGKAETRIDSILTDTEDNQVARVESHWQIKDWKQTSTQT